jgi:VIT1/CCC1 family predicted Fe2+/Mn2+ transporter
VVVAGVAGLVAGAMSMAAGEYVSVSSQADTEMADTSLERRELEADSEGERLELQQIYEARGLDAALAQQVAEQLTAKGALDAHIRDELGFSEHQRARPLQAALSSAATFSVGAALPLAAAWLAPMARISIIVTGVSLVVLVLLGSLSARAGGANPRVGAMRVTFWGAIAMAATWGVGRLFGAVV